MKVNEMKERIEESGKGGKARGKGKEKKVFENRCVLIIIIIIIIAIRAGKQI